MIEMEKGEEEGMCAVCWTRSGMQGLWDQIIRGEDLWALKR